MLANIQILRAFAALNVVLFHIIGTSSKYHQGVEFLKFLQGWGSNGVDLFFVISGFVMVYSLDRKSKTPREFMINRILRIVPLYWLLTLAEICLYSVVPSVFNFSPSVANTMASLFFVSKLTDTGSPLIYVGWTLEYEMLFYILFSIGLTLKNRTISFLFPVIILLLLVVTQVIDSMVVEFVFGMLCAKLYCSYKMKNHHLSIGLLLLGVLLISISIFYHTHYDRLFVYGVPATFIVYGIVSIPQTKNRILIYLGSASYSIYLMQVFSISGFYKFSSKFFPIMQTDVLATLALCSSAVLGCFVYQYLEKPSVSMCKNLLHPSTQ